MRTTKWFVDESMDNVKMQLGKAVIVHTAYQRYYKGKLFYITLYPDSYWTVETLNQFHEIVELATGFKALKDAKNWFVMHEIELSEKYGLEG